MGDVANRISRPDHRKSKFGLRDAIKLIGLYGVTVIYTDAPVCMSEPVEMMFETIR